MVNTRYGKELDKSFPLIGLFNHVIVAFELDGELIWADPTDSYQKGLVKGFNQPNYFKALILDNSENIFTSMDPGPLDIPSFEVEYDFDLRKEIPLFRVLSKSRFHSADYQRNRFNGSSVEIIKEDYLNFYTRYYPGIDSEKEIEVSDDSIDNIYSIVENYTVKDIWEIDDETDERMVNLYPIDLSSYIYKPRDIRRNMPISLDYPINIIHKVKARYGEDQGEYIPDSFSLKSEYIEYEFKSSFSHQELNNIYSFRTLKDSVPIEDVEQYLKDIDTIKDNMKHSYYTEFKKKELGGENSDIISVILIVVVMALFFLGIRREYRIKKDADNKSPF